MGHKNIRFGRFCYEYNIFPYYSSITSDNLIKPELPFSTRIPLYLYDKLLTNVPGAQGYHMYTDRRIVENEMSFNWNIENQ